MGSLAGQHDAGLPPDDKSLNIREKMNPLDAISTLQPQFPQAEVLRMLAEEFGVIGTLESLLSERDQNFRVTSPAGRRSVFKIANGAESDITTDFQIQALLHIERRGCPVATPVIHRTLSGNESATMFAGKVPHICRVVSHVSGTLLSTVIVTPQLAHAFGRSAASLDLALADFEHAGQNQVLPWDLQRASDLHELLGHVDDADLRTAASLCLDDYDRLVQPQLASLRCQVIHGDLNTDNVLAVADDHNSIAGVIDFGDMVRAPLIMEVAIAAAYLRVADGDPLSLIAPFVSGYTSVTSLTDGELELLFDLVRTRLVASITILRWRLAMRGKDDAYARQFLHGERSAERFLLRLDTLARGPFTDRIREAVNPAGAKTGCEKN